MDSEFILTVQEVLKRPLFQNAQVLAGEEGLLRRVRWAHILEVADFEQLIHGEELILTTGISFKSDIAFCVQYLQQLIEQNVSCLCIELGVSMEAIPKEMIDVANAHQFPLLIFPKKVRFVDITQDLHSLIINRHHRILQELESVSREFHRLTLTAQGISNVLKLLHTSSKAQVIFIPLQGQPSFVPAMPVSGQRELLDHLSPFIQDVSDKIDGTAPGTPYHTEYDNHTVILQPVGALGRTWAYLIMLLKEKPMEYDYLILDSASLSIAQDLLRKRYIEERKLYAENLWVDDLLHYRIKDEEQLKSLTGSEYKKLGEASYHVCLIEFELLREQEMDSALEGAESFGIHLSLVARSLFEQHGFYPLTTFKNNRLVVIAIDLSPKRAAKARLQQVFTSLLNSYLEEKSGAVKLGIGVGKAYSKLMNAHLSYQEAIQALSLQPCFNKQVLFFNELGVFQLLFNMNDRSQLQSYIDSYLGPLIEYDQNKGGDLLRTLRVYLDNGGSKQLAAQKLYVVRQSLYYRLDKIAELLGEEFMLPENQLALHVALRAYQLLNPEAHT
ncbi:PucR family transcriptional regulator [Paenibacillus sp. GCM10027628]|uniref:PucR family transcriptional regulator n=1 Tax=Paenibacillus sp. GCM10027628 TaxID=3273413 RepID=UPI00362562B7